MPALARKNSPESYHDHRIPSAGVVARVGNTARSNSVGKSFPIGKSVPASKSAPARKRWHEAPPQERSTPGRSTPDPEKQEDAENWRRLIDHFGSAETAHVELENKEIEARRVAKRKARLRHRPFRMTLLASALAGAPLMLLACLLWMKSSALALSREDATLEKKIAATQFELQNTRKEIAGVNASPQVEEWAKERGWRQATQKDFDDISKNEVSKSEVAKNDAPQNEVAIVVTPTNSQKLDIEQPQKTDAP